MKTTLSLNRPLIRPIAGATLVVVIALAYQSTASAQVTYQPAARYDANRTSYLPGTASGYISFAGGNSRFDSDCLPGSTCDDKERAFKLALGGLRSERYGLELAYLNFGNAQTGGGTQDAQGLNLSVVGYLPFSSGFTLFGKVGGTYGYTDTDTSLPGDASGTEQGFGLGYGVGAGYRFNDKIELTLEWESHRFKFKANDQDLEMATLGLRFHF
ncbi:MAG: outer membrane beta-barrel protein [Burkholderiaceae bacterium]